MAFENKKGRGQLVYAAWFAPLTLVMIHSHGNKSELKSFRSQTLEAPERFKQ